jgi:hypothetical protein
MSESVDFVVNRTNLRQTAFVAGQHSADSVLGPGQALLRVERFAFTANNITYGAVGELIGYWSFFPAKEGWGRIPVWGFADVVGSRCDSLPPGERIYGYWPMSHYLVVQVEHVSPAGFVDGSSHRSALPPIYNQYTRVAVEPGYHRTREPQIALFRPLFTTAFLLDDFLADNDCFGARSVLLSSASSKTALGLAFLLSQTGRCEVVGLTSSTNKAFVERTGYYSRAVNYDDLPSLSKEMPAVFVDFAGNSAVVSGVHRALGGSLKYSCSVGVTHWEKMAPSADLPGPAPILFFAPDHAKRRIGDWGAAGAQTRVSEAMGRFLGSADWLRVVEGRGQAAVEAVYRAALEGKMDPSEGHILAL